ncbi:MFS transporter [Paenibacillus lactis]|uniref:MFS transporter n=1 Tax=Paenibacillus lactis TaxID=228574 RepID=UPI00203FF435|nr:MFS transporter [Paenibacillus lactis]MCM3495694.1 MFS transporter [Paenibacillus lactis]
MNRTLQQGSARRDSERRRLSSEAGVTLFNHGIYQFGNALAAILVNLYLWRLTNDLWVNGMFNLITLAAAPVASVFIGKLAKLKDRLLAYRLGIGLTALFYLGILIAVERMADYYVGFALLKGISTAFYWLGHFTLINDVTDHDNRHRYLGVNLTITNLSMLAGPAAAGALVEWSGGMQGYTYVYLLAFAMFVYASVNSLRMKKQATHHKAYYLKYAFRMMRKYPAFGRSLAGWFLFGLPQGILGYIPAILLFQAVPRESFVNYLNVAFLGVTMLSGLVLARWGRAEWNDLYLAAAAIGFIAGVIPLFLGVQLWTVILFMAVFSLVKPLQNNAYTSHYYKLSGELPLKEHFKVESVVLREIFTNAGRGTGVAIYMLIPGSLTDSPIAWMLMAIALLQLLIGWLASPVFPAMRITLSGQRNRDL